jgi:hypothetical protein
MADGQLSAGLLKDVADLFEKLQSSFMLTEKERNEIIDAVYDAVIITEIFFGKAKSRKVVQNNKVAKAWNNAGKTIIKYLPAEELGHLLQIKGEAWANPDKWSSDILRKNNLQIEQIKDRLKLLTSTKRKFFRPTDI